VWSRPEPHPVWLLILFPYHGIPSILDIFLLLSIGSDAVKGTGDLSTFQDAILKRREKGGGANVCQTLKSKTIAAYSEVLSKIADFLQETNDVFRSNLIVSIHV